MQLIPVIDLLDGEVVHARLGQRQLYRPIDSPLCRSSSPVGVLDALRTLYPFQLCYLADLNAIQHNGNNRATVTNLLSAFPECHFWLDAGNQISLQHPRLSAVLGSESYSGLSALRADLQQYPDAILSLDFSSDTLQGPQELMLQPHLWPAQVIVMELNAVGSGEGPVLSRLVKLRQQSPATRFYAAGGIRNAVDVETLAQLGCAGALLASALHDGRFSREQLQHLITC